MENKKEREMRISVFVFFTPAIVVISLGLWGISLLAVLTILVLEIIVVVYTLKYYKPKMKKEEAVIRNGNNH